MLRSECALTTLLTKLIKGLSACDHEPEAGPHRVRSVHEGTEHWPSRRGVNPSKTDQSISLTKNCYIGQDGPIGLDGMDPGHGLPVTDI